MELLEAVNIILPALGEHPVTRIDIRHPTLAVILPVIGARQKACLLRGWWFNEYDVQLYPNNEGEIAMPTETLAFLPERGCEGSIRKNKLFNQASMSFKWEGAVKGKLKVMMPFNELPESVAQYIFYGALVQSYFTDIGLEAVVAEWKQYVKEAEFSASDEHLRNKRHSTTKSGRYARLRRAMRA